MSGGRARRQSIPVIVIAGYLGSGKTTLLNHLLRTAQQTRIGVLVNDFGAINVDALLIAGQADGTVSLSNGCMCCAVDAAGVEAALAQLARPAAGIDAIVIEASGIAEPRTLIRMVTGLSDPRLRYGGLVYVVDAAGVDDLRARHPEVDRHMAIADLVVVNKADLVGAAERDQVSAMVRQINPTAPVVTATDGAIDADLLFDRGDPPRDPAQKTGQMTLDELLADDHPCGVNNHTHMHDAYESLAFDTDRPMNPRRLAGILERPPAGCYRIKGVVSFDVAGHRDKFIVHSVGGFVRAERRTWAGEARRTEIVTIGAGLDVAATRAVLESAVVTDEDAEDEYGILQITRHLPDAGVGTSDVTGP